MTLRTFAAQSGALSGAMEREQHHRWPDHRRRSDIPPWAAVGPSVHPLSRYRKSGRERIRGAHSGKFVRHEGPPVTAKSLYLFAGPVSGRQSPGLIRRRSHRAGAPAVGHSITRKVVGS